MKSTELHQMFIKKGWSSTMRKEAITFIRMKKVN